MDRKVCLSCGHKLKLGRSCPCKQEGEGMVVHKMEDKEDSSEEMVEEEMWEEKGGMDILSEDYFRSLPPGWWVKEVQVGMGSVVKKFIDSRGKEFMGRIAAVRKLVAKGRTEEAAVLRSGLAADGWIQHPLLPTGWWVKPDRVMNNQTRFRFLTASNVWFVGVRKAVSELSSGKYSLEEVERLHRMLEEFSASGRMVSTTWQPGGEDMPEGWRFKRCAGKKQGIYTKVCVTTRISCKSLTAVQVLSPLGEVFPNKGRAIAHMVSNGFPEQQVSYGQYTAVVRNLNGNISLPSKAVQTG